MTRIFLTLTLLTSFLGAAPEGPDPAVAKLRDSLKTTMLQLRTEQGERAKIQAEKEELEIAKKKLEDQVATMTKNMADDKARADKSIAELTTKNEAQAKQATVLNDSLKQWQESHKKFENLAGTKESERARLAGEVVRLDRKVLDRETKNLELYKVGKEILSRYENYGLGRALLSKEPFTGLTKVKLQTLVQDYADKLTDQKIKPEGSKAAAAAKTTTPPPPSTPSKEAPKSDAKPKS
jgi:chromosome segregation ATPase